MEHYNEGYRCKPIANMLSGKHSNISNLGARGPGYHSYPLIFLFSTVFGVLARATRQEKEIKQIQAGKEEIKLSLFTDLILHKKEPLKATRKLLNLMNTFNNVAGYKIKI